MSNIFISHSSQDAPLAREIAQALRDGNYASLFLDIDEQDGIKSFEDWEQVLYRKLRAARAVIAICTDHWLASKWCFAEIAIARALGKPVLPVVSMPLEDGGIEKLPAQLAVRQVIDLRKQTQRGLTRLAGALSELGLQPSLGNWDSKRCPYPGLIAYDESHASVFFGREPEVAHGIELLRRIRTSRMDRFVTVVGASGTGKSSLVRAGIIPIVRTIPDQPWSVVLVRPFRAVFAPVAELADALAVTFGGERSVYRDLINNNADFAAVLRDLREQSDHPDAIVLLVLDQFEECLSGEPELELFLQLITDAVRRDESVVVLVTLRSDFMSTMQAHPTLKTIDKRWFPIEPIGQEGIVRFLTESARKVEVSFEDQLLVRIKQEVGDGRALPLLAFTLRRLWEIGITADDRILRLKEYEQVGGIRGAVASWALECVPEQTDKEQLEALRTSFQSLVRIDDEGRHRRRRSRWQDLDPKSHRLLTRLIDGHLLISTDHEGDRVVEVAHESLFEAWDLLRGWLREDHGLLTLRHELSDAAALWIRDGEAIDDLWRGGRLEHAREQQDRGHLRFVGNEHRFLESSIKEAKRTQAEVEQRRAERIRLATVSFSRALAIQARDELKLFPQRALALAVEALSATCDEGLPVTSEAESALRDLLSVLGGRIHRSVRSAANVLSVAPGGHQLAAGYSDGTVGVWLLEAGQPNGPFLKLGRHDGEVHRLAWYQNFLYSSGDDGVVTRWNPGKRDLAPHYMRGHAKRLNRLAIDPNGRWLVVASGAELVVWPLDAGQEPVNLTGHQSPVRAITFDASGEILASSDYDGNLLVWNASGSSILPKPVTWQEAGGRIDSVVFDPQGRFLVTGGLEGVLLWRFDTDNDQPQIRVQEFQGLRDYVVRVQLNENADVIVAATYDGRTACWLADDEFAVPVQLDMGDARLPLFPFDASGRYLLTTGRSEPRISIWHLESIRDNARPTVLRGDDKVRPVLFLPDGSPASADEYGTLRVWQTSHAQPAVVIAPPNGLDLNQCAVSLDAAVVIAAGETIARGRELDRRAKLIDASSAEVLVFESFESGVDAVALCADGSRLALGGRKDEIEVIDRGGLTRTIACPDGARCLSLSPDGGLLAAGRSGLVRVWDLAQSTEKPLAIEKIDGSLLELSFSARGNSLVASDNLGNIHVWHVSGEGLRLRKALQHDTASVGLRAGLTADGDTLVSLLAPSLTLASLDKEPGEPVELDMGPASQWMLRASFAISADKTRIVAATDGSRVARFWDLSQDGTAPVDLLGHDDGIWDVAITMDGSRIASVSKDGTLRLWSPENKDSVVIKVPLGPAWRVAFRGDQVLAVSNAGICSWLLETDALIARASQTASRNLTEDEWARFLMGVRRETFPGID